MHHSQLGDGSALLGLRAGAPLRSLSVSAGWNMSTVGRRLERRATNIADSLNALLLGLPRLQTAGATDHVPGHARDRAGAAAREQLNSIIRWSQHNTMRTLTPMLRFLVRTVHFFVYIWNPWNSNGMQGYLIAPSGP